MPLDIPNYGSLGVIMKPSKKGPKTSSLREILILCYFLALVCVELSLIVVLDISHDRGF